MRALVTGGAGFIGSNLVRELVAIGHQVDVVDDMSNGHMEFLKDLNTRSVLPTLLTSAQDIRTSTQVLVVHGCFSSPEILARVEAGLYDVIFHLAANPRVSYTVAHPAETTEVNVNFTMKLVQSASIAKNKPRIVFSSTCAVYGNAAKLPTDEWTEKNPQSPYALQKWTVEQFLKMSSKLYDVDSICLRYFNVYGPNQLGDSPYSTAISSWCDKVSKGLPLRSDGDGEQTRDMIFVDDVVRANIIAANTTFKAYGEAFNIGTGTRVSNNQILNLFRRKFRNLQVVRAPERPGDVKHTQANVANAKAILEFDAKTDLETGLEKTFRWWGI